MSACQEKTTASSTIFQLVDDLQNCTRKVYLSNFCMLRLTSCCVFPHVWNSNKPDGKSSEELMMKYSYLDVSMARFLRNSMWICLMQVCLSLAELVLSARKIGQVQAR